MTVEEAKQCMFSKRPVIHHGIRYEKISALIFTLDDSDNIVVLAALIDKSKNCLVHARIQNITISEE